MEIKLIHTNPKKLNGLLGYKELTIVGSIPFAIEKPHTEAGWCLGLIVNLFICKTDEATIVQISDKDLFIDIEDGHYIVD